MSYPNLQLEEIEDLQKFQKAIENSNLAHATSVYSMFTPYYFADTNSAPLLKNYQSWQELYAAVKLEYDQSVDAKAFEQLLTALQKRVDQEEVFFELHHSDFEKELFYILAGRGYLNIWQFICNNCYLAKYPDAKPNSRDELLTFVKNILPATNQYHEKYIHIILDALNNKLALEKKENLISESELSDYIINNFKKTKELCTLVNRHIKSKKIAIHKFLPPTKKLKEIAFFIKFNISFEQNINSLYSVLITLTNFRMNKTKKDLSTYQKCRICWRYVPISFSGNKNKVLCHFQNYNEKNGDRFQKAYERGNKFHKKRSRPLIQTKILENCTFLEMPSNDDYKALINWYVDFLADPCKAEKTLPFECKWGNIDELLKYLPYIKKSADAKNIILNSPQSIIQYLMPENPDADLEEIAQIKAMHRIWEKNFFVFARDLDCAENTIREYYRLNNKIYFFD